MWFSPEYQHFGAHYANPAAGRKRVPRSVAFTNLSGWYFIMRLRRAFEISSGVAVRDSPAQSIALEGLVGRGLLRCVPPPYIPKANTQEMLVSASDHWTRGSPLSAAS